MKTPEFWGSKSWVTGIIAAVCLVCEAEPGVDFEAGRRWRGWVDMGGTFGASTELREFAGPASGKLELSPGFQMDLGFGYRVTRWLMVGPELGFTFNSVDSFGGFSYHDTTLFQMPMMAQVTLEYPNSGHWLPYAGGGIGGVASFLTFGDSGYYYEPDGSGSDFVLGFQAFAGLRYRFNGHSSIGVVYRFLATEPQNFDVEWWDWYHFNVSTGPIQMHSVCLVFTSSF